MSAMPCIVLGATGYVGGEFLRLVAAHPRLRLHAAVARSASGTPVRQAFPHLAPLYGEERFTDFESVMQQLPETPLAAFCALPHAQAAQQIAELLDAHDDIRVVDASADFRFDDPEAFASIYGASHPAPQLLDAFARGVPEFVARSGHRHASQPGCFATAMQLAMVPALQLGWGDGEFFATGITGSTGAGKTPVDTTHMPERHANLFAYKPLAHRHAAEVVAQVHAATDQRPTLHFVPHAGPFARGIHMTVMTRAITEADADTLTDALEVFYAHAPFVSVERTAPRLKQVVGSNHARLSVTRDDQAVCITVVIDNLLKGAAGGAMQWMNRLQGWPEHSGLEQTAIGWS